LSTIENYPKILMFKSLLSRSPAISLALLLSWSLAVSQAFSSTTLDRALVVVNNEVVTQGEIEFVKRQLGQELETKGIKLSDDALTQRAIEKKIIELLQLQEAERIRLEVTPTELDGAITKIAQRTGLTLDQLKEAVINQGLSYPQYLNNIRDEVLISKLVDQMVRRKVDVSEEEIDNYILQHPAELQSNHRYDLSHLLVSFSKSATVEEIERGREKISQAVELLEQGVAFSDVARRFSDAADAEKGGHLGWRLSEQLPDLYLKALSGLSDGKVSDVLRSPAGFHLIRLNQQQGDEGAIVQQWRVRHILKSVDRAAGQDQYSVRDEMLRLRHRLANGEDFAKLAQTHSDDRRTRSNGGDLGWISPGDVVPEFEEGIKELPNNEISQPIESRYGFHLIQVTGTRRQDIGTKLVRNRASRQLRADKTKEQLEGWISGLRSKAFIEIYLDQ
jgi:peptidyl-prolyl cis-trans isomerase SurA